jgi:hypothetical protein
MFLFSVARLVFGVVVVSRRILNDNRPRGISGQGDDVAGRGEGVYRDPWGIRLAIGKPTSYPGRIAPRVAAVAGAKVAVNPL